MKKYLLVVGIWAALSYPIYQFLPRWCVVAYGFLTVLGLLIWAGTRKSSTIKRNA